MAPKPVVTQVSNEASPFAQEFMDQLMKGNVGYASPLQRNIGGAYESLIAQGPQFFDHSKQFDALQDIFGQNLRTGSANVKEGFSIGGSRYGTAAGVGLGRFTAQAGAQQNALLADIAFKSYTDALNRQIQMLGGADAFSRGAIAPFLTMAQQGIVNPAVNMQENPWVTGINTAANVAGAVLPFFDRTSGVQTAGPPMSGGRAANPYGYDYYGGMTNRPGHEPIPIGVRVPYGVGGSNFAPVPDVTVPDRR